METRELMRWFFDTHSDSECVRLLTLWAELQLCGAPNTGREIKRRARGGGPTGDEDLAQPAVRAVSAHAGGGRL